MSPNQIHLALLHFPVVLPFVGLALLAGAAWRHNTLLWRASLATFVASALLAWPVFLSGEESEERIEHAPGVSEELIEEHEEAAKIAQVAIQVLGGAAVVALLVTRSSVDVKRWMTGAVAVLAVAASSAVGVAAHEGGKIRHPEIRGETGGPAGSGERKVRDHDD